MAGESPLGRQTTYPQHYAPSLLFPVARADSRDRLALPVDLPFHGEDIWNAWDLTWLAANGQPQVASAEIRVPAKTPYIIESKSLKLYLNSLSMTQFESVSAVSDVIRVDLSEVAKGEVSVRLEVPPAGDAHRGGEFDGDCIDDPVVDCDAYSVDPGLLANAHSGRIEETLYSHALRSLCPVTAQPDLGSVMIRYRGTSIDHAGLLRYIVSFRNHEDFHEACVERMFVDIQNRCAPEQLVVYARFQRRGGIDINPFRSTANQRADNLRLWRQ